MTEDVANGWWEAPPAENWKCPECGETSPVAEWQECEPYCEACGSHDGRRCPKCERDFDHVYGAEKIRDAQ